MRQWTRSSVRKRIVACLAPIQYLKKRRLIVELTIIDNFRYVNQNAKSIVLPKMHLSLQSVHILGFTLLTHYGRDKMNAILQTVFSNAFCWMKNFQFKKSNS